MEEGAERGTMQEEEEKRREGEVVSERGRERVGENEERSRRS